MNQLAARFMLSVTPQLPLRFNIAPTQDVAIVRKTAEHSQRELALVRWGLIPSWAKDAKIRSRCINARGETVADKPSFRAAFKRRRCLVLADGYYEWQMRESEQSGPKQPYYLTMRDERPFAFAGLWENWRETVQSCTIITTEANELTAGIHDRMPVILREEHYDLWLDPLLHERAPLLPLLVPLDSDEMKAVLVSTHVNNVRNDDPACIEALRD